MTDSPSARAFARLRDLGVVRASVNATGFVFLLWDDLAFRDYSAFGNSPTGGKCDWRLTDRGARLATGSRSAMGAALVGRLAL